jgi:hypothetical protein
MNVMANGMMNLLSKPPGLINEDLTFKSTRHGARVHFRDKRWVEKRINNASLTYVLLWDVDSFHSTTADCILQVYLSERSLMKKQRGDRSWTTFIRCSRYEIFNPRSRPKCRAFAPPLPLTYREQILTSLFT